MLFEGKPSNDEFDVRVHDLGNGHKEASVSRVIVWAELKRATVDELAEWARPLTEDEEAEKRQANSKRAARRAKTRVRRLCKALGLDTMVTLTYRALVTDLGLCKRHTKEFVRRMKRTVPGFRYVAAFETQKRGCWHVHMAVHRVQPSFVVKGVRVKSYDLVRSIWRSVTGELGGNVDLCRAKPWKRYSPGRLAAYLSKYMLKAFEAGEDWSNRYSGSEVGPMAPALRLRFVGETLAAMVELVYSEVCVGDVDTFTWLSRFGDAFYMSTEPDLPPVGGGNRT
jgi:hypothetical protein